MFKITSIDDERILNFKHLKKVSVEQNNSGFFVTESELVTLKLLESELNILSLFGTLDFYNNNIKLITHRVKSQYQYYADKKLLNSIVGYNLHGGIMAIAEIPLDFKLNSMSDKIIVMNSITDSENIGSIIRNAAAFGINSIIYDNATTSPWMRRSVRVSMGTIFSMKLKKTVRIKDDLLKLKELNYSIIAIENHPSAIDLEKVIINNNSVLIFGNEKWGISDEILEICDCIVKIPINTHISSINVAAASAIVFYKTTIQN